MLATFRKGDQFGLDARAVARPYALDLSVVKGRIRQAASQYFMDFRIGETGPARKLEKINPETLAQAGRIPGVSPSDINVLLVLLGR
jgi:hypothetical protein